MSTMPTGTSRFRATVGIGWLLIAAAATVYARMKGIPAWAAVPIAAALLLELPFYLLPAFSGVRENLRSVGRIRFAALLTAGSVAPWLAYSLPTGEFRLPAFGLLLLVAAAVSFWYIVLPPGAAADVLFLIGLATIVAGKLFNPIYLSPLPGVNLAILGHVMLIRTGVLSLLQFRGSTTGEYRFWPHRSEWITGLRYFVLLIPITGAAYWALGLVRLREHPLNVLQAVGTFFGILWVVALSEEFFFRGLLQQWMEKWTASAAVALVVTSLLFGSVHLGMHNQFPNWRFATVAAIAGFFYGLAWRKSRSVQASMVAHALTVTLWRTFLR